MSRRAVTYAYVAGVGTALGLQAWGPVRFARMTGSSIAAPDAAPWITDFLNAAYFRRPADERAVDDLRLAHAILTTRWHRLGHRRMRAPDAAAFHRDFGRARSLDGTRSARGTLSREQLLEGAAQLHGPWFPGAYADDATHEGHFMGSGNNRLVLFEQDGAAFVRAAGTWDPMPWHLEQAYERAGREAQHAFWGQGPDPAQSMLHQIAERLGAPAPVA